MRELPVELDDETIRALETERSLIGFESRSAYVRWIVEHRAAIDDGTDDRRLEAYRERIAELEAELEALRRRDGPRSADRPSSGDVDVDATGEGKRERGGQMNADGGWTRTRAGTRTADADTNAAPTTAPCDGAPGRGEDENEGESEDEIESPGNDDAIRSVNLTPDRIDRIRNDPVADDADVLDTVEVDRLDELSRRAVAKTRKRLDRDVQTGLEYSSTTDLAADAADVRPGEDVADLDELSLPGRSEAVLEKRRAAAGRALAYLRDEGRARKSDFVDALYDDVSAEYDTADGWWRCVKEALRQVDAVDGGDGSRVWRYTG